MGAERHSDIVARFGRADTGRTSTGALAAHLGRACGHVSVDSRVLQQGFRFYPELSDEIPSFFNKRLSTGSTNVSITLQAGFDPSAHEQPNSLLSTTDCWAIDPFDDCHSNAQARKIIEADDYHASLWMCTITVGVQMYDVSQISDPLFIAKHPNEFRLIAEELVAVGILQGHACTMCGD